MKWIKRDKIEALSKTTTFLLILLLIETTALVPVTAAFSFSIGPPYRYSTIKRTDISSRVTCNSNMDDNHHDTSSASPLSPMEIAPLICLDSAIWNQPLLVDAKEGAYITQEQQDVGDTVVQALQRSGFLLVQSDLMPRELQQRALQDATRWLTAPKESNNNPDNLVTVHPTDPKVYVMLDANHISSTPNGLTPVLIQYYKACDVVKACVLRAIAVGLQWEHPEDLAAWHWSGQNSAMRLLYYPPISSTTTSTTDTDTNQNSNPKSDENTTAPVIRCKAHSDYGTVTLLSTDGVSGLEIFLEGTWWPVPHIPGAVVVNIGSLLSEWTSASATTTTSKEEGGQTDMTTSTKKKKTMKKLLATLHRVAGGTTKPTTTTSSHDPGQGGGSSSSSAGASDNTSSSDSARQTELQEAMSQGRASIAFFADPDNDTPLTQHKGMTMQDYIEWRSGGSSSARSGVAFTEEENELLKG